MKLRSKIKSLKNLGPCLLKCNPKMTENKLDGSLPILISVTRLTKDVLQNIWIKVSEPIN